MLGDSTAIATIAVKDITRAKQFYQNTLGLKALDSDQQGVVNYKTGKTKVLVYQSQFAGSNRATAATWELADVEAVVNKLKSKGVAFEHYDMPGMTVKGDVHVAGGFKAAWFKDPDGNILALVGG
ncbi:MAG TPA: VOC family protein [Gemmatimonadaceae bacterium]|nr:VOC family protein [Gemmatimonadaceae bacterium]